MTNVPSPLANTAAVASDVKPKRVNGPAIGSAVIGILLLSLFLLVKLLAVSFSGSDVDFTTPSIVLGVLGLIAVLPAIIGIVLGHVALATSKKYGGRGRATAGIGLALGYTQLVLWLLRIVLAIVASNVFPDGNKDPLELFVTNIFYWA
jgi:hypothetical protein